MAFRHRAAVGERQRLGFGLEGEGFLEAGFALGGGVGALLELGVAFERGLVVAVVEVIGDRAGGLRVLRGEWGGGEEDCEDGEGGFHLMGS